mgnify:CR=1 FL=1
MLPKTPISNNELSLKSIIHAHCMSIVEDKLSLIDAELCSYQKSLA